MTVQVNLSNNESLTINRDTKITVWKGTNDKNKEGNVEYYAEALYNGAAIDGEELATSDQRVALQGLFSHSDWFSIDSNPNKLFKTSAIVSIED